MQTRKWLKRLLLLVAIALVIVLGALFTGLYLVRAEPAFYRRIVLTVEQREAAAQRASSKFADIQNAAARMHAEARAAARAGERSTSSLPTTAPTVTPITVS